MRSFVVMAMFAASLAHAGWRDYSEVRDLKISSDGIAGLEVEAGAGSLEVTGVPGGRNIVVVATITIENANDDEAGEIIASNLTLMLERDGDRARLKAYFDRADWAHSSNATINLEVKVPTGVSLKVHDGSGSIDVNDIAADILIDDGSGSIKIGNVGSLSIDDGSGSISVTGAAGDVFIVDGSGSITVRRVGGSVTIDDGSGSIEVHDIEKDLIIENDGSGSVSISGVRGRVEHDS